jgi:hypothetical protein
MNSWDKLVKREPLSRDAALGIFVVCLFVCTVLFFSLIKHLHDVRLTNSSDCVRSCMSGMNCGYQNSSMLFETRVKANESYCAAIEEKRLAALRESFLDAKMMPSDLMNDKRRNPCVDSKVILKARTGEPITKHAYLSFISECVEFERMAIADSAARKFAREQMEAVK